MIRPVWNYYVCFLLSDRTLAFTSLLASAYDMYMYGYAPFKLVLLLLSFPFFFQRCSIFQRGLSNLWLISLAVNIRIYCPGVIYVCIQNSMDVEFNDLVGNTIVYREFQNRSQNQFIVRILP